jgi:hypothetical protein
MKINKTLIFALIALIIIVVGLGLKFLVFKGENKPPQKPTGNSQTATSSSSYEPTLITEDNNEGIKVNYFSTTGEILVNIEANSVDEYISKIEKSVTILKDSGMDPCLAKWPTPKNLKNQLKEEDIRRIRELTCPQKNSTATSSAVS